MTTVEPKLLYSPSKHEDIPVWEITTSKGVKMYYERIRYRGYRPIGLLDTCKLGKSTLHICGLVTPPRNRFPKVLRAKDGYVAPVSWYERDPDYDGPLLDLPQEFELESTDDQPNDDQWTGGEY